MGERTRGLISGLLKMILILLPALSFGTLARGETGRLERVSVVKPQVEVTYICDDHEEKPKAWLGGEKLRLESNVIFPETGEWIGYVFLVDISASVPQDRFADIRESLVSFLQEMRPQDRLILYTFGDQVKQVLGGQESREEALAVIRSLVNYDQNTLLFEAMNEAADRVYELQSGRDGHYCLAVISDGKDCADNTKSAESMEKKLSSLGIPVYTYAVENREGDSVVDTQDYRSRFSSMATGTGGMPWTVDQGTTLLHGMQSQRDAILNSYRALFKASTNRVSNQNEDLVFQYPGGARETRSVLVASSVEDHTAPTAVAEVTGEDEILITFSEPVFGGEVAGNYRLTVEGKKIPLRKVTAGGKKADAYVLTTESDLKNGSYVVTLSGITDASNEENVLEETTVPFEVRDRDADAVDHEAPTVIRIQEYDHNGFLITFSEAVLNVEVNGNFQVSRKDKPIAVKQAFRTENRKDEVALVLDRPLQNGAYRIVMNGILDDSEEANPLAASAWEVEVTDISFVRSALNFLGIWWPLVLSIAVALLAAFIGLMLWRMKKKKYTIIRGEIVEPGQIGEKLHVEVKQASHDGIPAVIWIGGEGGNLTRTEHVVTDNFVIGRSSKKCNIFCDDETMSREHFALTAIGQDEIWIRDLGTVNGTFVNGQRIYAQQPLQRGSLIQAGKLVFKVEW